MAGRSLRTLIAILFFATLSLGSALVYGVEKININTASEAELVSLDGIGEGIAKRIVEYRDMYDGFKYIEELQNVKGIAGKKFEKIMEAITIGDEDNDKLTQVDHENTVE